MRIWARQATPQPRFGPTPQGGNPISPRRCSCFAYCPPANPSALLALRQSPPSNFMRQLLTGPASGCLICEFGLVGPLVGLSLGHGNAHGANMFCSCSSDSFFLAAFRRGRQNMFCRPAGATAMLHAATCHPVAVDGLEYSMLWLIWTLVICGLARRAGKLRALDPSLDPAFDVAQKCWFIIRRGERGLRPSADSTANFVQNKRSSSSWLVARKLRCLKGMR